MLIYAVAVGDVFVYVQASSMEENSKIPAILNSSKGQIDKY